MFVFHALFLPALSITAIPIRSGNTRRSMTPDSVVDAAYVRREIQGVLLKYAGASRFLPGTLSNTTLNDPDPPLDSYMNSTQSQVSNTDILPPLIVSTTGIGIMPLEDVMDEESVDMLYYGPIKFGTPSQSLTVDVDTGSADLWIPVNCRTCVNGQFDARSSSTYTGSNTKFKVTYGVGQVSGILASDTVSIAGMSVDRQYFGAVSRESSDFGLYPNDGLLGMGFSALSSSHQLTFFENLIQDQKVTQPMFSVHLTRGKASGAEVCFGCHDATKAKGPISWLPVVTKSYWLIFMDGLAVNPTVVVSTNLVAAIDTGTTFIYVPDDVAAQFYTMIAGAEIAPQYGPGVYTFPCNSSLSVALSFSGRTFLLNQYDFNLGKTDTNSSDCVGGIFSLGDGFPPRLAIVGAEFLKSWYSTYDYSNGARVGFSPSINN